MWDELQSLQGPSIPLVFSEIALGIPELGGRAVSKMQLWSSALRRSETKDYLYSYLCILAEISFS